MNFSHYKTGKIMIVIFALIFSIIIGVKACKFAEKTANDTQNRIDAAFSVLKNK